MNLILTVLEIVTPVFLLALIGFTWVKTGHEYRLEFVTKLTMTLSVPALIFTALIKADIDPAALTALSLASVAAYGGVTIAAWITVKALKLDTRTYLAPLIFGNTGNLGLPLALFAFGEAGLSYAVVVFAAMALWSFTFGIYVTAGRGSLGKAFKEPLVWATALGALFLWQGWTLPRVAMYTLEMLGQIAIPLMLITLGVAVARLHPRGLGRATLISLGKVVLCAGIAALAGMYFNLDPVPFAVLVVQIATPVAVTSYMLAEKYGADSDSVAALVVSSTLLSVLYLPLLLAMVI
ncbi:AEC family transporter [Celeribacter naphthalenivorans]|uniref:AEC family transporter n=1 Tax=Celeribacter naphthalenivorans TaxID=1614694 RepID=UPI001CFA6836|nr:AEC family transporter [Celeribacter naphthalenivorans]